MFFSEIYQPGVADFDPSGKLGYEAILRIFENTASRHSDSSGDDIIAAFLNDVVATPTARATTSWRTAATASPGC